MRTSDEKEQFLEMGPTSEVTNEFEEAKAVPVQVLRQLPLATGMTFAVATGLFDGTLMTAFTAFEQEERGRDGEGGGGEGSGGGDSASTVEAEALRLMLSYLLSFALVLPCVALPVVVALLRLGLGDGDEVPVEEAVEDESRSESRPFKWMRSLFAIDPGTGSAGLACGALWAMGNAMSVHATLGLGQAIGFPLTQVRCLCTALLCVEFDQENALSSCLLQRRPRLPLLAMCTTRCVFW